MGLIFINQDLRYFMSDQPIPLAWGDAVRIHGVSYKKADNVKGLVIAKGFTDPSVYYQKYQKFEDVNFYRQSLFQIWPKGIFDLHDQLLEEQTKHQLTDDQRQKLAQSAKNELQTLKSSLEARVGKPITYGSEFILVHIESKGYLQASFEAADVGDGAFKLKITHFPSSQVNFMFKSHRSFERDDHHIFYDDQLLIYNEKADCYMNFSTDQQPIYLDQNKNKNVEIPEGDQSYEFFKNRPSIKKPKQERIAVINENKSKCLWKLILHCRYEQSLEKKNIISHDIVYFQHTKAKGLVSSTLADKKFYLKEMQSGASMSFECFWQLTPKEAAEFGPETCKVFRARNVVTGQLLTHQREDRSTFEVQVKGKATQNADNDSGFQNRGMVELICSEPNEDNVYQKLERGQPQQRSGDTPKIVDYYESKITKLSLVPVEELPLDSFMINSVDEETTYNIMFALSAHEPIVKFLETVSTEFFNRPKEDYPQWFADVYRRGEESALANLVTILKMLTERIYGCNYDEIQTSGNMPNPIFQKILVETGIAELVVECVYHLYTPMIVIEQQRYQPSEDKSTRNKIQQMFECSYKLLEKIAANNEQNRIYMSRWVKLIVEQSNNLNKAYIQFCILGMLQNNPVSIQFTINEKTIVNLIDRFFGQIQALKESDQIPIKYLRLFSTFIKCEKQVIKENQKVILKKYFLDPKNEHNFKFKVEYKMNQDEETLNDPLAKVRSREVYVSFRRKSFLPLPEFFHSYPQYWNYFLAWVDLLADVCMERNSQAIQTVSSQFITLQTVIVILFDESIQELNDQIKVLEKPKQKPSAEEIKRMTPEQLDEAMQTKSFPINNVHQPFIRIAHHVYVNNDNFNPIHSIGRISQWYGHQDADGSQIEEINQTKRVFEGQKQEQEKKYLQNLLMYIKIFLKTCNQEASNLPILDTVLDLLQNTVFLGLWENMYSFKELIPYLIMRITKIENTTLFQITDPKLFLKEQVQVNKESLKLNRPEIVNLIRCKIKATNIFRLVNELEIDIRLRYLMNFFRGVYKVSTDFEKYNLEDTQFEAQNQNQISSRNQIAKEEYMKIDSKYLLGGVKKLPDEQDVIMKPNIWYNKLKQLTPFTNPQMLNEEGTEQFFLEKAMNRYLFSDVESNGYSFGDVVLALFELPAYNNIKLLDNSLKMLRAMFEQRSQLINNFKAMQICGKGNLHQVYLTLKFMRTKFDMLDNPQVLRYELREKIFAYQIYKPYDHLIKDESKRSGIIQDLFFLARTLKEGVSLKNIESLMHVEEDVFDADKIFCFITERERNNDLFQQLNLAERIYVPLIGYIRQVSHNPITETHRRLLFSIYQYLTLLCFNNLEAKQILMSFIPDVMPHVGKRVGASSFIYHVSLNNKLLVSDEFLVSTIIDGSLEACAQLSPREEQKNQMEEQGFVRSMLNKTSNTNDYQKSRILFSLRGILLYNQEGSKRNQQLLMNRLQDARYKQFIFLEPTPFTDLPEKFNLNPKETYVATIFELLSIMVESESFINIGKLQNIYQYKYLLQCLRQTNRWQIRRGIRAFINRLYYVNKDKDIFIFEYFVQAQLFIINKELADLIQLHKSRMLTNDLKIKNGIRFVYAQSEILLMIIQIMISLHQMFLKKPVLQLIVSEFNRQEKTTASTRKYHDQIILLLKNLGCMHKLYPKTKPISPFIREIKRLLSKLLIENMQLRWLEKRSQPQDDSKKRGDDEGQQNVSELQSKKYQFDQSKSFFRNLGDLIRSLKAKQKLDQLKKDYKEKKSQLNMPEKQQKERYIELIFGVPSEHKLKPVNVKPKQIQQSHYNPHLMSTHSKTFKVLAKPNFTENQQNFELNKKLNEVKDMIDDLPIFKKLKDDEFNVLVKAFTVINKTSKKYYAENWGEQKRLPIYSITEIITKTFQLIRNNPTDVQDQEKIFIIKLIRCYITEGLEREQEFKLDVDKWDADYYENQTEEEKSKQKLVKRQNLIKECGGSQFIIAILQQKLAGRVDLLNQILLMGIAYLYNGNTECQNSILDCLKGDPQNTMMANIYSLISTIGNFLIEVRQIKENEKKREFAYKIVDTYDYYNMTEFILEKEFGHRTQDKYQVQTQDSYEKALCRTFRFLQLFCENNNIKMKEFILQQINEDGNKKDNTINFIDTACVLLRRLFKIMNDRVVSIPSPVIQFLKEVTQTPCIQNQKSMMKSTFFQDISYMAEQFINKKNILNRKFNIINLVPNEGDPRQTLAAIYQTGIGLALSNFEGNDECLQHQFISKCKPRYLWLVIKQNLLALLKQKRQAYGIPDITQDQDDDIRVVQQLFEALDFDRIKQLIEDQIARKPIFQKQILNIISVLSVMKKIKDFEETKEKLAHADKQNINQEQNEKALKAAQFREQFEAIGKAEFKKFDDFLVYFNDLILSIEVFSNNGRKDGIQYVYFPKHPIFRFLAGDTRDYIMLNVERGTHRDKLISLLDFREDIYSEIELNYDLKYKKNDFWIIKSNLPITSQLLNKVKNIARYISLLIIFLTLTVVYVEHDTENMSSYFTYYNLKEMFFVKLICFVQLFTSILYFILWLKMRLSLAQKKYQKAKEKASQQEKAEGGGGEQQVDSDEQDKPEQIEPQEGSENQPGQHQQAENQPSEEPSKEQDMRPKDDQPNQKSERQLPAGEKPDLPHENPQGSTQAVLEKDPFHLKKFNKAQDVTFELLGGLWAQITKVFDWISNTQIYQSRIVPIVAMFNYQSSFLSTLSFLATAFAGNFLGVEWYTIHLFDFFVSISSLKNVFKSVFDNLKLLSILSALCTAFILVFNVISFSTYTGVIYEGEETPEEPCQSMMDCVLVMYNSGPVGGDMEQFEVARFLFDTGYVVFMEMLFGSIVGGILMDSYSNLTTVDEERNKDKKTLCYVCGMAKEDMEKNSETFKKHTNKHFMWNYIYYIYCLKHCKPETEYTGIEYIITNQIQQQAVLWFPSDSSSDSGVDIESLFNNFENTINTMADQTSKLTEKTFIASKKNVTKLKKLNDQTKKLKELLPVPE